MILRATPRPRKQVHATCQCLRSFASRPILSTRSFELPLRPQSRSRKAWQPQRPTSRQLASQATGFEGHRIPSLAQGGTYTEKGVNGFLSSEGFDLAWTQYQSMMIDKLNSMTQGTVDATSRVQSLVEKYARSTEKASLFNAASMAYNNHLFFSCLSPTPVTPSPHFLAEINNVFSTFDTLRAELLATADAMFGPGFVWLVKDNDLGSLRLLVTYIAGSPLPRAHLRAQQLDTSTQGPFSGPAAPFSRHLEPTSAMGGFGAHSRSGDAARPLGGYDATPLLCVSTWQHTYLRDYGVGGRRLYLERWWERVDWGVVERNAKDAGPERTRGTGAVLKGSFGRARNFF